MQNVKIRDPALTPLGKEQAQKLIRDPVLARALVAGTGRAEAVVVSPLQRTLQTAVIGLGAGTGSAGLSDVPCVALHAPPRVYAALARSLCLRESLVMLLLGALCKRQVHRTAGLPRSPQPPG